MSVYRRILPLDLVLQVDHLYWNFKHHFNYKMDNWDPFGDSNNDSVTAISGQSDQSELAWPPLEPATSTNKDNPMDLFTSNSNTESISLYPTLSSEETETADVDSVDTTQDKTVMSNVTGDVTTTGSNITSESTSQTNDSVNHPGKKVKIVL